MMHPDDRQETVSACRTAAAAGREIHAEYRVLTSTGQVIWVAMSAHGRQDAQGLVQFRGGLLDITALKRTEKLQQLVYELETSRDQLKEKLEALEQHEAALRDTQAQLLQASKLASIGELAAGIAHELNNPLNNIGLCVGNALDRAELQHYEHLTDALRTVNEQVRRGAAIISHLRTFARTDRGRTRPHHAERRHPTGRSIREGNTPVGQYLGAYGAVQHGSAYLGECSSSRAIDN
jgi:C4-dicarboxylate-specific signal transduction histidine kinase